MIGRKTGLALANMFLGSVLGIVALFLIGRFFGADANGQVTYAMGILGLLFFITDLGMGQAHVKRVSEGRPPGDLFATYTVFKLVATGLFVAIALGFLLVYTVLLHKSFEDTTPTVLGVCLFYYVTKALQDIGQSSFEARVETAKAQVASLVDTLVRVGLTIVFALVLAAGLGAAGPLARFVPDADPIVVWIRANPGESLAIALAAGGAAAASVSLVMLSRILEQGKFRFSILKDYARFALPLFMGSAILIVAGNVDAAALGYFLGKTDAGVFGAIRRIPGVLQGIGGALGVLLFPTISRLAAEGDRDGVQTHVDRGLRYLSMLLVPLVAFVILFAEPLIRIGVGNDFVSGANALRLLCVYALLGSFGYAHYAILMGNGRTGTVAWLGIVHALIVIVLDLVLIPNDIKSLGIKLGGLGVLGAGIATLTAGIVWYALMRIINARVLGYHERDHVWRHLLAAALMALALWGMDVFIVPLHRWYHLPLYAGTGALVYLGGLVLARAFTREDWTFLKSVAHPGEMIAYVRAELGGRKP
jgi:O-antigen/teichoic acid export membrane protein